MRLLNTVTLLAVLSALPILAPASNLRDHTSLRSIKAIKPDTTLTLLDKVESDIYRKEYEYNDYGYITSVKVYDKNESNWILDTDLSYGQTYAFDNSGQCTERIRYSLKPNGEHNLMTQSSAIVKEGDLTWERTWDLNKHNELYLKKAVAYDKWGNLSIEINYEYDDNSYRHYVNTYHETHYSRQIPSEDHINYQGYSDYFKTFELEGYGSLQHEEKVFVKTARKVVDEKSAGKLERKEYYWYYCGEDKTLEEINDGWQLDMTTLYTLNAKGTRPTSMIRNGRTVTTWQWDKQDRLVCKTDYSFFLGDSTSVRYEYSYADDYAPYRPLNEIIATDTPICFYPEDASFFYGHPASERCYDYTHILETSYEYNKSGRLVKKTQVRKTGSDDQETEQTISTYGYRDDGHWAYERTVAEGYSTTTEFIYDSNGTWTDTETKYDNAEDCSGDLPSSQTRATASTWQSQQPTASPSLTEDMSDGRHYIDMSDGNWRFDGYYYVNDGKIESGDYRIYITSNCSVPRNPELNYTDPTMPLEGEKDEYANAIALPEWRYSWDKANQEWKLIYGTGGDCTYRDGDIIKTDTYNSDRQITHTTVYSFDSKNRLIRTVSSATGSPSPSTYTQYTYLGDTNYLSTRYTSDNNELRHYYYSSHDYVDPTGIDNATDKPATGDDRYYDLQGRPVSHPSNGIYIHHGRKVLIKKANF